jgi:WD40-like Beta Propeller Repeat
MFFSCKNDEEVASSKEITFSQPQKVTIAGYESDIMEPFLSKDGEILYFNNSNDPSVDTNIHYATRVDDLTFEYEGELTGVNSTSLDGVASIDVNDKFYFVSLRSYDQTLSSLYTGDVSNGNVSNVQLVDGVSRNVAGWVNFDVEISPDGNQLYFVDGRFDANGGPYEADFVLANKVNGVFERMNDATTFKNVNTDELEYAACLSSDMLELYFTRLAFPITTPPQIFVATRNAIDDDFNIPNLITEITGFVEAPTISPDNQRIYYHKNENNKFVLYMVQKQ